MATTFYEWIGQTGFPPVNNVVTAGDQLEVTAVANPAGTLYMTAWTSPLAGSRAVQGRLFHGDGTPATNEFSIADGPLDQTEVSLAALADGRFVAVYSHDPSNAAGNDVLARIVNADGSIAQSIAIAAQGLSDSRPDVTALADGGFAVSWTRVVAGSFDILMSVHNADGSLRHSLDTVSANANRSVSSSITGLAGGGFVIAWDEETLSSEYEVLFRRFDANGTALDGTDAQGVLIDTAGTLNRDIQLAALPDGGFVVAYTDNGWNGGATGTDITAQVFNANGTPRTLASLVNSNAVAGDQFDPTIAVMDDGHFVVGWQTGDEQSFQVYDRLGNKLGANAALAIDSRGGELADLGGSRFAYVWQSEISDGSFDSVQALHLEFTRVLYGSDSSETINGHSGAITEIIRGEGGHDTLTGGGGRNGFNGGQGDDIIVGGPGDDTAHFDHVLGHNTLYDFGSKIVVRGLGGFDQLYGIEHLRFGDGRRIDVVDDGNALFDTLNYFSRNVDVLDAKVNALDHFNLHGWHEGRDPNSHFDTSGYLAVNTDVAAAGVNPLDHYHQSGWREGRDPSASFDTTLYLINNPDVAAAGINPLEHFLQYGAAEGRQAHAAVGQSIVGGFDAQYYLFHNPDVAAAGVDALAHFNAYGWHEGRNPNGHFNTAGYLSHYSDVAAAGMNPLDHYMAHGWQEGRDPSAGFDTQGYLAANPDVTAAHIDPLTHYLQYGTYEGRAIVNDGMWG